MPTPAPSTPAAFGYRMPAEWHPHEATWLTWPKDPLTWPGNLRQVQDTFLEIISHLGLRETVHLLVDDAETEAGIEERIAPLEIPRDSVRFHRIPTADSWIRDYGPNFLVREREGLLELAYNHWDFNAWGGKYEDLIRDREIPEILEPILRAPRFRPGIVLEGGSIDVNGCGDCLTTEQCLLNPNRNPDLDRPQIERILKDYLNLTQVIWLGEGIAGDDTDGHVDDVARFVSPETVVCVVEEDPADENHPILQDTLQRLLRARTSKGTPLQVIRLPTPGRIEGREGRLPASYANFYIANGLVLLPVFGHPNDARAQRILQSLFPDRRVVPVDCRFLVWGMGTIHCTTQQQPAVELPADEG